MPKNSNGFCVIFEENINDTKIRTYREGYNYNFRKIMMLIFIFKDPNPNRELIEIMNYEHQKILWERRLDEKINGYRC